MKSTTRTYDSSNRKVQAEARRVRILKCAADLLANSSDDEFRLEDVAQAADVSVQTILRAFGSKDGLMVATLESVAPDAIDLSVFNNIQVKDLDQLIITMFKVYEKIGDLVIHALAHEHRSPEFQKSLDVGREFHKGWVSDAFAVHIKRRPPNERATLFHALLAATDIYIWKVLRRDEVLSFEASVDTVVITLKSLIQENKS